MPKIIVDGREITCRDGIAVLQAALDAGWDVPHYCYHPALSVVASCRLCLMEMKAPHPKTAELTWMPKLVPSCQTPVRDGMEVRFNSDMVRENQRHCMEYFLLNHPLDCPVCDQAGECYLQDYSYRFGAPASRMVDPKLKNPKKDIGPRTLLYQDRCVMCSRCVRFTDEVSGTGELCIVNRGTRSEIDVFPGIPLDNPLQGNVVDICPVGSLLDKDFLFAQRVWLLQSAPSVCPGCSTGCTIRIDHNEGRVHRLKPRFNPQVNDYWMCDDGRFGWKYVHDRQRLTAPLLRRGQERDAARWEDVPAALRYRFEHFVKTCPDRQVAVVLSPMLACEEAWLLCQFIRSVAPQAALVMGHVPVDGQDQHFPAGVRPEAARFVIRNEKCPNRRGIQRVQEALGGASLGLQEFLAACGGRGIGAAWITGGYPDGGWISKELAAAAEKIDLLVVQDLWPSALTEAAEVVLPMCAWTEREGTFINHAGLVQPFSRAVDPPDGGRRDGQWLHELAGLSGLYDAGRVRQQMAAHMAEFKEVHVPPLRPKHQH
jgi:NADH-quinone oxidoreductase subunit G